LWAHTTAQRKARALSGGPWFVVRKNVTDNAIYVSRGYDTEKQYGREILLDEMHWITRDPQLTDITFKNRHTPEFIPGKLIRLDDGKFRIESEQKVQGIAPGQFAVIYDRNREICYGSAVITL